MRFKAQSNEREAGSTRAEGGFEYPDIYIAGEYGTYQKQYEKHKAQLQRYPEFEHLQYEDTTPKSDGELFYPEMMFEEKLKQLGAKVNDLRQRASLNNSSDTARPPVQSSSAIGMVRTNNKDLAIPEVRSAVPTQVARADQDATATFTFAADKTETIDGKAATYFKQYDAIEGVPEAEIAELKHTLDAETARKLVAYARANKLDPEYVLEAVSQFKTGLLSKQGLEHLDAADINRYAVFKAFEQEGRERFDLDNMLSTNAKKTMQNFGDEKVENQNDETQEKAKTLSTTEQDLSADKAVKSLRVKEIISNSVATENIGEQARHLMIDDYYGSPSIYYVYDDEESAELSDYFGVTKNTVAIAGRKNFRAFIGRNVAKNYKEHPDKYPNYDYYVELAKEKKSFEKDMLQSLAVDTHYRDSVFAELKDVEDPLQYLEAFDEAKIAQYCADKFSTIPFYRQDPENFLRLFTGEIERGKALLVLYSTVKKDVELLKRYDWSYNVQGGTAVEARRLYGAFVSLYDPRLGKEYIREAMKISKAINNANDIGMSWMGAGGGNLLFAISRMHTLTAAGVVAAATAPVISVGGATYSSGSYLLSLLQLFSDNVEIEIQGKEQGDSTDVIFNKQVNKTGKNLIKKTLPKLNPSPWYKIFNYLNLFQESFTDSETKKKIDSLNKEITDSKSTISAEEYKDVSFK